MRFDDDVFIGGHDGVLPVVMPPVYSRGGGLDQPVRGVRHRARRPDRAASKPAFGGCYEGRSRRGVFSRKVRRNPRDTSAALPCGRGPGRRGYLNPNWRETLRPLTGGRPVDVIFDAVGGDISPVAFRTLGWRGRHLVVGFAAGRLPSLQFNIALLKGASAPGIRTGACLISASADSRTCCVPTARSGGPPRTPARPGSRGRVRPPGRRLSRRAGSSRVRRPAERSRASVDPPAAIASVSVALIAGTSRRARTPGTVWRQPQRRNPGAEQRFADIDVAQPGDHRLVQQRRLDRRLLAASAASSTAAVNPSSSGSGPKPGQQAVRVLLRGLDQVDRAEAARIDKADAPAVVGLQLQVLVQGDVVRGRPAPAPCAPDMPRCSSTDQPLSSRIRMYLPRRRNLVTRAPVKRVHQTRGQRPAHVGPVGDGAHQRGGPPGASAGRASRFRLRGVPAWPGSGYTPPPMSDNPATTVGFRLPHRGPRRESRHGARCLRQRRNALRPDERPDVAGHPSGLEADLHQRPGAAAAAYAAGSGGRHRRHQLRLAAARRRAGAADRHQQLHAVASGATAR